MKNLILKKLQSNIQGEVFYKKEFIDYYSVDASSYQIYPKIIVIAKNEKDVINTIKIAKKFKTSVTVRGAGTGLVGSALNKGIILDLKNFDSIRLNNNQVIVGPGTMKGQLDSKKITVKHSRRSFLQKRIHRLLFCRRKFIPNSSKNYSCCKK